MVIETLHQDQMVLEALHQEHKIIYHQDLFITIIHQDQIITIMVLEQQLHQDKILTIVHQELQVVVELHLLEQIVEQCQVEEDK